jgi:acyl carrier protein
MLANEYSQVVIDAINELNQTLDTPINTEFGGDAPIYGKHGVLDSISLVSLIVNVEQKIEDQFGVSIILANEKAMSQRNSPFLTIGTLSSYLQTLVEGNHHD